MMTNNFQTNSKNKGGRPVKKIKRTKQLNLIFTESEFSAIVKKAEARGMKPTTFCYFLIEAVAEVVLKPNYVDPRQDDELTRKKKKKSR